MTAYYNEIDRFAAAWLRNLIAGGYIADGEVDERDIRDVQPEDLHGFSQVHLFAGIGGWSLALKIAGWPDDVPVWTGSCPCQPFSTAGKRLGFDDSRHLWPEFFRLIQECRPATIFGEQVASKAGLAWFDVVSAELEREGYACGAADLAAAGVGSPQKRQRLFWVADSQSQRQHWGEYSTGEAGGHSSEDGSSNVRVGSANEQRRQGLGLHLRERGPLEGLSEAAGASKGCAWAEPEWVLCMDPGGPRWRPAEPGTFPLADGVPGRVGLLRGYGNAIVPQVAAEFIMSTMELTNADA